MKISCNKRSSGVVLLVALFTIVAAGIIIAGYLTLMNSETRIVSRSQIWNQCVPVMEAGVEEAMAQIHYCNGTTNLSTNNWTLTNGYYQKNRSLGTDGSYCVIQILPTTPQVIYSTAYVPVPGTSTNYIKRQVRVSGTNAYASGGLESKGTITMTGNAQLDSYNSLLGSYNSSSPGTNAVAVTDSTSNPAINMAGSAKIYGMAVTGPGGTITNSGTSAVGDNPASSPGVQSGCYANDANVQINDINAPSTNGWFTSLPASGTVGLSITNYNYVFNNANYYLPSGLSLTGIQNAVIVGNVTLYLAGSFTVQNSGFVYLAQNATLTIYCGGNIDLQGAGIVGNGNASAVTIYGLSTCTNAQFLNGSDFYGSINVPDANVTVNGNGAVYGAIIGNTITLGNSGKVHFDQGLSGANFYAATWNEL